MAMRWLRGNIGVDGDGFLERLFGASWIPPVFPSAEGKRNRDTYELWIERLLGYITKSAVGYWVLWEINSASSKKVIIKPWIEDSEMEQQTPSNPYGVAKWEDTAPKKDVVREIQHEMSDGRVKTERVIGTGQGSDYVLRYTPWFLPSTSLTSAGPGYAPDEVLLHELVHAMNGVKAEMTQWLPGPTGYKNLEEFCAILITNLYSSQTNRTLRKDHNGHQPLVATKDANLPDPQVYYTYYQSYVQDVVARHNEIAKIYSGWDAGFVPFNPFRYAKI
jgi:hypothetical protein